MIAETLQTPRLTLRRPEAGDLEAYTAYCASPRSQFVRGPFTAPQAFEKFATMAGHWLLRGYGRYIMVRDGAPIGHVGPAQHGDTSAPEMTWSLWDGADEGRGYATEAARAVTAHLMGDVGWPGMDILILPENAASLALARRLGAEPTDAPAPAWYPGCVTYRLRGEGTA